LRQSAVFAAAAAAAILAAGTAAAQDLRAQAEQYLSQRDLFRPGFGEDEGLPSGAPLVLPAGARVSAPILGVDDPGECAGPKGGAGGSVRVCLPLCNTTAARVRVRLPAGLTLVSKSASRYQNGVLLQEVVVDVPPSQCGPGGIPLDEDPEALEARGGPARAPRGFAVALDMFCLNEERAPSEQDLPYALGPVSDDPDIQDLITRVRGRTLDEDAVEVLQTAIWSITEGRGLTPADRSALAAL